MKIVENELFSRIVIIYVKLTAWKLIVFAGIVLHALRNAIHHTIPHKLELNEEW